MPRDFFDPTPEEQVIVLVEHEIVRNAEGLIKIPYGPKTEITQPHDSNS